MKTCLYQNCIKTFEPKNNRKYCSESCRSKARVTRWRIRLKMKAVDYKGGKCCRCGYDSCLAALVFHHRDPKTKLFSLGNSGESRSWKRVKEELDKCDLLCANCHAEIEYCTVV